MRSTKSTYLIRPETGERLEMPGVGVIYKVGSELTGGAFSIIEHPVAPLAMVPPHTHAHEDELSYVVSGEIGALVGDEELVAPAGSYVLKPRGISHAFWNPTDRPALILELIWPPRFAEYFRELAATFTPGGPPDMERIGRIAARYGLTFQMDKLEELSKRYGLRPM